MAWKPGPMPPNTWGWGGVALKGKGMEKGFFFADFQGDCAVLIPGGKLVKADKIAWYDNSLTLPPKAALRMGGMGNVATG